MTTKTRPAHFDEIGTSSCSCRFAATLRPSVHDDALEWANGHKEGAAEQIYYFAEQLMSDHWVVGELPWVDFPDFVSEHNWDDPAGVTHVAGAVVALIHASGKPAQLAPEIAAGFDARIDALTEQLDELLEKVKRHLSNRSKAAS